MSCACGDPHDCYCHEGEDVAAVIRDLRATADRNARFVEKVRELVDDTNPAELSYYIKTWHREIYNAPCKPVEPVKE
jgi:hypothetical protein